MSINQTRYIKNNTGSERIYVGSPIQPGEFYLIPASKYTTYASSSDVLTDIANSNISISLDGETTIESINDQIDALKGFSGPTDSDGVVLSRSKITQTGWHYQMYGIEVTTSKLNSIVNTDYDSSNLGHCTLKFYNSSGTELTSGLQLELDLNCTRTVLDWEPPWDYEIIGGQFRQLSIPASDLRLHVVAVPDIAAEYGGSVPFVNGVNLRYVGNEDSIRTDGRTSKKLVYSNVYHTNKIRVVLDHMLLLQHKMHLMMEIYRA